MRTSPLRLVRINARLTESDMVRLGSIAERQDLNMTDAIRRAIRLSEWALNAVDAGGKILLRDSGGATRELLLEKW